MVGADVTVAVVAAAAAAAAGGGAGEGLESPDHSLNGKKGVMMGGGSGSGDASGGGNGIGNGIGNGNGIGSGGLLLKHEKGRNGGSGGGGGGGWGAVVEVRLEDARAVIVRGEREGGVAEGGLRRVGFEIGEWVRGWEEREGESSGMRRGS